MAAPGEKVSFSYMDEEKMRQWVEANPGRVNDRDTCGDTPLFKAASHIKSVALVLWLVDKKGADVNATTSKGQSSLHEAGSFDIFTALLDRGANPILPGEYDHSPLMRHARSGNIKAVARLLEDPRVRTTVNLHSLYLRETALHLACQIKADHNRDCIVRLLLRAGARPDTAGSRGDTPLTCLRKLPPNHATISLIALLDQAPGTNFVVLLEEAADAEKASLLVKARRLVVASTSHTATPSCLRGRVARRQPLPRVTLAPVLIGYNGEERHDAFGIALIYIFGLLARPRKDDEKHRKHRDLVAFLLGVGGGSKGEGMPRDVFLLVLDFLMPSWDPLRRGLISAGSPMQE
jgi:hypothetical protein